MPVLTRPSPPSALRRGLVGVLSVALAAAALVATPAQAAPPGADVEAAAAIAVRVNQLGYLPDGPKRATVVTTASAPTAWELRGATGATVASGTTTVRGGDTASGDSTHLVDFSSYTGTGTGYTLLVDGQTSHPFDIRAGLYNGLRSDAMSFFYQQRSGIAIEASLMRRRRLRPSRRASRGGAQQGGHQRAVPGGRLRLQP